MTFGFATEAERRIWKASRPRLKREGPASEAKWEGLAWKIRLPAPVKASDLYKNRPLSVYRNLIISEAVLPCAEYQSVHLARIKAGKSKAASLEAEY